MLLSDKDQHVLLCTQRGEVYNLLSNLTLAFEFDLYQDEPASLYVGDRPA